MTDAATEWGTVAAAWDEHVNWVNEQTRDATEALVDALEIQPGDRVVELAAGPGALAPTWADLTGPTGSVLVTDVSPEMIAVARRRAAELPNVDVAPADLEALDLPDAAFDAVACRHGLQFATDPGAALAAIRRVLAPGGRLGAMVWGPLERNPWITCIGMAAMVHGITADGPPVGPGQIFSLGDADKLADLARTAGFTDVAVTEFPVTMLGESMDSYFDRQTALAGPLAAVLRTAEPDQIAALRATAAEFAAPYTASDGSVALPGLALLLTARAGSGE